MSTFSINKEGDQYTTNRQPFKGSNIWGEWVKNMYVVYSYSYDIPIFAWDEQLGMWFGNKDKYTRSTTRHQSLLRPDTNRIEYITTREIKDLISAGGVNAWTNR